MSSKCLTLYCALVLLACIAASAQAEQRKTLQPLPLVQLERQSKDLRKPVEELYPLDDEDGNDIVEDPADAELDDEEIEKELAALNENDDSDLELADEGSIAELTKLIESLEATLKRHDGGAAAARGLDGRAAPRRNRKNNRCGANKRNGRRGGNGKRPNGAKRRNGQKRRNGGGKRTQRA